MLTQHTQRWKKGRESYRPAGEPIDTSRFEVAAIQDDNTAKSFVLEHHYLGSYPAARRRFGLYGEHGALCGVAVFSVPCNPHTLTGCLACAPQASVELGRFVLLDEVAANGETWFLARCFALLKRDGFEGVVSFSDPVARRSPQGKLIFGGHIGTIYQAHNATYLGRARAKFLYVLPDGRTIHRRAMAKLIGGERGWRYVADTLMDYGATTAPTISRTARAAWAHTWLARLVTKQRHGGNLKYAWGLTRSVRRTLPSSKPYVKLRDFSLSRLDI